MAEGEGEFSIFVLVETTEAVDLRFERVVGVSFLGTIAFFGGGTGGVEFVEVVDRVDGVGEALRGSFGDGEGSSIDDVAVVRFVLTERFDATEALRTRMGDLDGEVGELTPRDVLAVFALVVEALEMADTVLILFVDWTVKLLFLVEEGPSEAVLKLEDASLAVETRDCGLETESVGLGSEALFWGSVFGEVDTFRSVEARDLTEGVMGRSAGFLDVWLRVGLLSGVLRIFRSVESTDRVVERTEDDAGVSFESGREPGLNILFLGVPFVVVLETVERVLRAIEWMELAED